MKNPDQRLEKIHRQAEGSRIIQASVLVREYGKAALDMLNDNDNDEYVSINEDTAFDLLEMLYEYGEDPSDIALITRTNKERIRLNNFARAARWGSPDLPPQDDDLFICLRNTKKRIPNPRLYNGMRGRLAGPVIEQPERAEQQHWWSGVWYFPDDELEVRGWMLKSQLNREGTYETFEDTGLRSSKADPSWEPFGLLLDYGYALTCHKAQGSSFKHVFVFCDQPSHGWSDNDDYETRWLYTAMTRASEQLYIVR